MRVNLANIPVLMLNASYEALGPVSAKRAFTMLAKGKVVMEKTTTVSIRSGSQPFIVPSVIRLLEYARVPRKSRTMSRRSILMRDNNTCQYCLQPFPASQLTLDHIIPQSRNGPSTWENLVVSCKPCNNVKAARTPEEAGMPLLRRPRPFTIHTSRSILRESALHQKDWQKYLFYENDTPQESMVQSG